MKQSTGFWFCSCILLGKGHSRTSCESKMKYAATCRAPGKIPGTIQHRKLLVMAGKLQKFYRRAYLDIKALQGVRLVKAGLICKRHKTNSTILEGCQVGFSTTTFPVHLSTSLQIRFEMKTWPCIYQTLITNSTGGKREQAILYDYSEDFMANVPGI